MRTIPARPLMRAAMLCGLLAGGAASASAQIPPPPPPPPAPPMPVGSGAPSGPVVPGLRGTGMILGQIVDAGSGRPIGGATVAIVSPRTGTDEPIAVERQLELIASGLAPAGPTDTPVLTDSDGRFLFRNLAKGAHTLRVTAPGYVTSSFGQQRPDGGGRPIELADAERRTDVTIRMWKFAAIGGTVIDEAGEPMIGRPVRAFRRAWTNGRARFSSMVSTQTDDRGRFRLANLMPGDYLVVSPSSVVNVPVSATEDYLRAVAAGNSAQVSLERMSTGAPIASGPAVRVGGNDVIIGSLSTDVLFPAAGRPLVYPSAFYANASTANEATVVSLGSGEERSGVDVRMTPVPGVTVSGIVTGSTEAIAGLGVRLVPAGNEPVSSDVDLETAVTQVDAAGRFTFVAVPAGQYLLRGYRVPRGQTIVSEAVSMVGGMTVISGFTTQSATSDGRAFYAESQVTIGADDVADVVLTLRPGGRLSGRIDFEGAAPPPPQRVAQISISMTPLDGRANALSPIARAAEDGRFTTHGHPPGRYSVSATAPPGWTLESIMVNDKNALDRPVTLGTDDVNGVVVTFSNRVTELSGSVQSSAASKGGATILLFPADVTGWIADGMMPRRTTTTRANETGTFTLRPPSAGEYLIAALPESESAQLSPEFYTALARVATRVSFAAGEKKTIALTLVTR